MAEHIQATFERNLLFIDRISAIVGQGFTRGDWFIYPKVIYHWFVRVFIASTLFCAYTFIRHHGGDIDMIAQSNVNITIVVQCLVKSAAYNIKRTKILELIKKSRDFRRNHLNTEKEFEYARDWTNRSRIVPPSIVFSYNVTILVSMLMAFISKGDSNLPYALEIPGIPREISPYFELNYLYQIIGMAYPILATSATDGIFAICVQEACLQLDVVNEKFLQIGQEMELEGNNGQIREEHTRILHEIHVMHLEANEFVYEINDIFAASLFAQFANSTYGVTFLLVLLAQSTEFNAGTYSILLAFVTQIFIWSWIGEQTRSKMNNMVQAMYNNKWYNLATSGRKSLFIMMSCNQKEYSLSAGGLIDLTLQTFVSIMRTAYSYYAVMNDSASK